MKREKKWNALAILNILMNTDGYLTTNELCSRVDCERKAVYSALALLEVNGFHIETVTPTDFSKCKQNKYKYAGLYGI